jgi:long-chain acyl-CoA synthetase
MVQKPPFTIEAPGCEPVEGETIPRRHPKAKDGLVNLPAPDVTTTFELLKRSSEKYASEPAVGSRKLIKIHKEMKKVPKVVDGQVTEVDKEWTFLELSDYSYLTYSEYATMALQIGAGLRKLGLSPQDKLHLFAGTRLVSAQRGRLSVVIKLTAGRRHVVHTGSPWHMPARRSL